MNSAVDFISPHILDYLECFKVEMIKQTAEGIRD